MYERPPGTLQGVLLLLPVTMSVMGVVVLAPVLPQMQAHFQNVPGAEFLVPLALTIPGLCIALLSPLAGALVDFLGRRRILIIALLAYAGIGVLPLILNDLTEIIASRVILGALEAVIMTASTTLIGDYFHGGEREKWLAYQTALANTSAVVLLALGGALGTLSWRAPFVVYATSLLFASGLLLWTWEPVRSAEPSAHASPRIRFPWKTLLPLCLLAVFGGIMFFTVQIQLSYLLTNSYGVQSSGMIGALTAVGSLSIPVGSFAYVRTARFPIAIKLLLAFGLMGISFVLMKHATTIFMLTCDVIVNQFGAGILLPTLVVWTMSALPYEVRGRGTGLFMTGLLLGQFLNPPTIILLNHHLGGLPNSLALLGVLCLGAAVLALLGGWRQWMTIAAGRSAGARRRT